MPDIIFSAIKALSFRASLLNWPHVKEILRETRHPIEVQSFPLVEAGVVGSGSFPVCRRALEGMVRSYLAKITLKTFVSTTEGIPGKCKSF